MAVRHGTLTANTAATVTVAGGRQEVGVTHKNPAATDPIYARADGTAATIAGNDTFTILPGMTRWIPRPRNLTGTNTNVSLISAGANPYEVELP